MATGLRGLRRSANLTQEALARLVEVSLRQYIRYEQTNQVPIDRRDALATALGVARGELDAVLVDAPANGLSIPLTQTLYITLEQGASRVWAFQPWTIHALLQTSAYATAVEQTNHPAPTVEAVTLRVEARIARQRVLFKADPLSLLVILDESVLLRSTGGAAVMHEQLTYLVKVAQLPNVELRVLPLTAGIHPGPVRNFTMVASDGAPGPQVVCVPDGARVHYDETTAGIRTHQEVFDHLRTHCLSATDSVAYIDRTNQERYRYP